MAPYQCKPKAPVTLNYILRRITTHVMKPQKLNIALAQIAPVWLNKAASIEKLVSAINEASQQGCQLLATGESWLPGYPFWLSNTDAARFNSDIQKRLHARYLQEGIDIEAGDLNPICEAARTNQIAIILGAMERPQSKGGHTLYASRVYITENGEIGSVHRKLMPTYEERLSWGPGDGHGLVTHKLQGFTVSSLNCWENWMPLARASLYAQGTNLHVAIWPGSEWNTHDITRFIAKEGRTFVVSVSGFLISQQITDDLPDADLLRQVSPDIMAAGGSCVAGPDGEWILPPQNNSEGIFTVEVDLQHVLEERQNFDPSGHYARPDVLQLTVNRQRQDSIKTIDT